MRVLYLHGFASSAHSSKARAFAAHLAAYGIRVDTPDFNEPSFESLTVSRMVAQTIAAMGDPADAGQPPLVLIGSSLGAFVAVHAAATTDRVDRLILLAPALDFAAKRMNELGEDALRQWRDRGKLEVFHYGFGRVMPVGYGLYEDAAAYDAFALSLAMPVLIFQGTRDTVVSPDVAVRFAKGRPNVALRLLDDDHQLLASLPAIWEESRKFLGLPALT